MYKELDKYATGNKIDSIGVLPNKQEVTIQLDEYQAGFGDLINDFIEHKNKPFWKKRYYHDLLTELYIKWLNRIGVITTGY